MKQIFGVFLSCAIVLAVSHSPSFAGLSPFSLIVPAIGIAAKACSKTSTRKSCLAAKSNKTKATKATTAKSNKTTKPVATKYGKTKAIKPVAAKSSKTKATKSVAAKPQKKTTKLASAKANKNKRTKPVVLASKTETVATRAASLDSDKISSNPYKSQPIETICGDALNAERADWRTDSPNAPEEAKRRGETVSSCQAKLKLPAQSPPEEYAITITEAEDEGETAQH